MSLPDADRCGFSSNAHFCGVLCDSDGVCELQALPLPQPQVPTAGIRRSHDQSHDQSHDNPQYLYSMHVQYV